MSEQTYEGCAVVDCVGALGSTNGKTAHGLIRRSRRYRLAAILEPELAGQDAGQVLDGRPKGIPIVADLEQARAQAEKAGPPLSHYIIGLAPDGGRADEALRHRVRVALESGLHVVSGLHDFFSEDPDMRALAPNVTLNAERLAIMVAMTPAQRPQPPKSRSAV